MNDGWHLFQRLTDPVWLEPLSWHQSHLNKDYSFIKVNIYEQSIDIQTLQLCQEFDKIKHIKPIESSTALS